MRKRIPILFILALILPFTGIYCWLKFEKTAIQKSVKRQLMQGIPKEELITFSFAKEDTAKLLDWKHEKEFEWQGEMYDIVTRSYSQDSVSYDLWWDHEETALNRKLARLTNSLINQNPEQQSKNDYLNYVFRTLFSSDDEITLAEPLMFDAHSSPYNLSKTPVLTRSIEPASPPPQLFV
ncbi:hypothetical protein [Brumimicrobium aurantiacum]|uniref:hypothetical protein n=1 Tax=Brumimicrobium aurantiacum TaxID=1737063 RepID=UPI000F4F23DE|nr:hypothetical protein [Brumimicrobium aurantiacum]